MNNDIGHSIGQDSGSLKDINRSVVADKFSRDISSFIVQDVLLVASLKIEKLTAAIYLVSGLLSDTEPIKWSVRKTATEIVSDISMGSSLDASNGHIGHTCPIENISFKIFQITSMLRIAFIGGLISKMNFEILVSEYTKLNNYILKNLKLQKNSNQNIDKKFFLSTEISKLEESISSKKSNTNFLGESYIDNVEEFILEKKNIFEPRSSIKDISYKGHLSDTRMSVLKKDIHRPLEKSVVKSPRMVVTRMSDSAKIERHDKILKAMSHGISYSVSEIIETIGKDTGLSEKTIQRDLQQLVSIGRLTKTGERRWSRYSLS